MKVPSPHRTRSTQPRTTACAGYAGAPKTRALKLLGEVPTTLLIPLAARAFGDGVFPHYALGDAWAAKTAKLLDVDLQCFLQDHPSIFGVLVRTAVLRQWARDFFALHPRARGASLGCGLAHYFQWLNTGHNHWVDADCPQVMALRDHVLPSQCVRNTHARVDLRNARWWDQLGLARTRRHTPHVLIWALR